MLKCSKQLILLVLLLPLQAQALPLDEDEQAFLDRHWSGDTIPLQGTPPAGLSALEQSLDPADCGQCHYQQYQDWQGSLHARAMGPGVKGQILAMIEDDPATARLCWLCHTPMAEQQNVLFSPADDNWHENSAFSVKLQDQGLVCAACHVRQHRRYGPDPRPENGNTPVAPEHRPHNGFRAESVFSKSAFCKSCHQFDEQGYRLNGKLIEDTYNEWADSRYAQEGTQCQSCHMPGRRHQWRGIHDAEMTRNALDIDIQLNRKQSAGGSHLHAAIKLTNSGAGHYLPTYITPKIIVSGVMLDDQGQVIAGTQLEASIGREVTADLSQEIYDTRIPPGDFVEVIYDKPIPSRAVTFRVEAMVYPDHFYERFYRNRLQQEIPEQSRQLLTQAWQNARDSAYPIHRQDFAVGSGGKAAREEAGSRPAGADHRPDWNEANINWHDYASGMALAARLDKPVLLLFYADWCPTCHAYREIFYRRDIIEASKRFVMIRVNVDEHPELNRQYTVDGDYVPRTFRLDSVGTIIADEKTRDKPFRHFIRAGNHPRFLELMKENGS